MTTSKQLIEFLQTLPEDMIIVVSGYEGGYSDAFIDEADPFDLVLNIPRHKGIWYYGPHDAPRIDEESLPTVKAVCI